MVAGEREPRADCPPPRTTTRGRGLLGGTSAALPRLGTAWCRSLTRLRRPVAGLTIFRLGVVRGLSTTPVAGVLLERAGDLAALRAALDVVARERCGRLVLVRGEAGAGKTMLVRRFCDGATDARVRLAKRSKASQRGEHVHGVAEIVHEDVVERSRRFKGFRQYPVSGGKAACDFNTRKRSSDAHHEGLRKSVSRARRAL